MGLSISVLTIISASVIVVVAIILGRERPVRGLKGEERYYVRAPKYRWYVDVLNEIGYAIRNLTSYKILPVHVRRTIRQISDVPKSELFGSQEEVETAAKIVTREAAMAPLSPIGRVIMNNLFFNLGRVRHSVMKYVIDHPEIAKVEIKKPFIVLGLPRTGSTLLYGLLAQDPDSRSPYLWEMYHTNDVIPPARKENFETDPRIQTLKDRMNVLDQLVPGMLSEMSKSHVFKADQIDEELVIMFQQFCLALFLPVAGKDFEDWFFNENNKKAVYIYLKRFIQMLQSSFAPKSHWTLKSPVHALFLPSLLEAFPDARIVITHRNLENVVPSLAKYLESQISFYFEDGHLDRRLLGKVALRMAESVTKRLIAFREKSADKEQFFDVKYDNLLKDPIGTVKDIYAHFKIPFTEEFEKRMQTYIKENPQGKHGRASYDIADYDLNSEDMKTLFADYTRLYLS